MKPYGLPEDTFDKRSKKQARQEAKKEIEKQLAEYIFNAQLWDGLDSMNAVLLYYDTY